MAGHLSIRTNASLPVFTAHGRSRFTDDSALSKQLSTVEDAGYLQIERLVSDRRRRVRARLTDRGRTAFDGHVAVLRAILADADSPARRP